MTARNDTPLTKPRQQQPGTLRVVQLSGLGEVGRNMAVLEIAGSLLVIDCGTLFPTSEQPGVDLVIPDFSYISDRLDDVVALVLTHGHEDHIGAVPYLLRLRPDLPLVGSPFTLALVEAKLKEHGITPYTLAVGDGQREQLGPFECEFIPVTHSIPDAMAVAVRTSAGTVLHTGDFKLEQQPIDGRVTDLRAFARLGAEGCDLFMVDSTNSEVQGVNASESTIVPELDRLVATAPRRVIIASFASNVHRMQMVLDAAAANGRKVVLVGRSMVRNAGLALELGHLHAPDGLLVDVKQLDKLPDVKTVLLCTGSQGEQMAALARMVRGEHRVDVGQDDLVILSSSLIPGNESAVFGIIDGMVRRGARVVHSRNARVHVSGHATAGELMTCYNILGPRNVMPIHGEVRHQRANATLAVKSGVDPERVVLASNGTIVDVTPGGRAEVVGQVRADLVFVDGATVGSVTEDDLGERRVLGAEGFVTVVLVLDAQTRKLLAGPEVVVRGMAEPSTAFAPLRSALADAVAVALTETPDASSQRLQQVVRKVAGRFAGTQLQRKPMVVPVVVEV